MDFGNILTKAWKIIWKFKALWLFGILVSCGQGGGGGGGGGNAGIQFNNSNDNFPRGYEEFGRGIERFFEQISRIEIVFFIIAAVTLMLVIWLVVMALGTIGRVGLIQGTVQAEKGAERLNFVELLQSGFPYFWRVIGFNFLLGFVLFILVIGMLILMIPAAAVTFGVALLCFIPLICLLIPIGILVSIYMTIANNVIVNEDKSIRDAAERAWEILKENIGNIAVMAIILAVINFMISIIMAIPFFIIFVPLIAGVVAGAGFESGVLIGGGIASSLLCLVTYIPVLIILSGILQSFVQASWTLTYLEITGKEGVDLPELLEDPDPTQENKPGKEEEKDNHPEEAQEPIPDPD